MSSSYLNHPIPIVRHICTCNHQWPQWCLPISYCLFSFQALAECYHKNIYIAAETVAHFIHYKPIYKKPFSINWDMISWAPATWLNSASHDFPFGASINFLWISLRFSFRFLGGWFCKGYMHEDYSMEKGKRQLSWKHEWYYYVRLFFCSDGRRIVLDNY